MHTEAAGREDAAQRMKDLKRAGHAVYGQDPDTAGEKKAAFAKALEDAERARLQIHSDYRPGPYAPLPKPPVQALYVMPTAASPQVPEGLIFQVPSEGNTPGRPQDSSTSGTATLPIEVKPERMDPSVMAKLLVKKERLLASPVHSSSSGRARLEEIRQERVEAEKRLLELHRLERAYATTALSSSSSSNPKQVPFFDMATPKPFVGPMQETFNTASSLTGVQIGCLLYTSPSPRDGLLSRMPSSA